ncbi:MAG TPA: hypothetical protein VH183_08340 [Burkholderiaceae bacterium]|jgi:hypothetical protein|nr:hypothetical protein [Burkholderiaceae bacterium]
MRHLEPPFTAPVQTQSATPKSNELCGYGPVPVIDGIPQIPPIESTAEATLASLATDLAARSTERERALGLYLRMIAASEAAATAWRRGNGECADSDTACQSAAAQAIRAATAESRGALARLATTTSNANAYALALYSCRWETAVSDCALLSYSQWARIEPDNAVPWLYVAGDAAQRRDRGSLEAALNRASKARYSDPHWDEISRFLASDALGAQPPPVQFQLAIELLGIQAAFPLPDFPVLHEYCSTASQDPSRVQTCDDLAAVLIEHGRSHIEVLIGGKIVEWVGATDPRLSALRDEADAIGWQWSQMVRSAQDRTQDDVLLSCDSLRRLRRNTAARLQFGEAGYLRRELAASGVTIAQAAQRRRAERQALLRQAENLKPAQ